MEHYLVGAIESSAIYCTPCMAHSLFCAVRMAPTRRVIAVSLGSFCARRPARLSGYVALT